MERVEFEVFLLDTYRLLRKDPPEKRLVFCDYLRTAARDKEENIRVFVDDYCNAIMA